ncbi:dienelactone hydrolase family protein [Roseomonas sp. GC11]|uniref:alpha/beta hydrolase family protein n=1 Tax=Roseomonas sp. GC11 TaxID=2950546 RepID=UPI0021098484|nr:dienelactone hydrolase family protein [Roseomonas sp. GC11]MCQ4159793.1 dienelactone hydrolase family protein [Roseomonas sp. GC11]
MLFSILRLLGLMALCGVWGCPDARADSWQAGVVRLPFQDAAGQANALVWYPSPASEAPWQVGPFQINASQDAPLAQGRFPVVLLSHGRRGTPLSHRDLAAHLAREGFIVVAPTHLGDAASQPLENDQVRVLINRPRQAIAALNAALGDARFSGHADTGRIGMVGYSAGGYTALIVAGAKPDFARASAYCAAEGLGDGGSCMTWADHTGGASTLASWKPPTEPRLKALVLLDPLAIMFDAAGLVSLRMPVLLYRPQDDTYMKATGNALALARNLPLAPQEAVAPGRHFVFLNPCPPQIAAEQALLCQDAAGIDRVAIHREMEKTIAAFLKRSL